MDLVSAGSPGCAGTQVPMAQGTLHGISGGTSPTVQPPAQAAPQLACVEVLHLPEGLPASEMMPAVKGPFVLLIMTARWPPYLRRLAGIDMEPMVRRPALPAEPQTLVNGHPFAWAYRKPLQLLADEVRLVGLIYPDYIAELRERVAALPWADRCSSQDVPEKAAA